MFCMRGFRRDVIKLVLYCVTSFVKQKTAYELRISDWSSDVCSSDLIGLPSLGVQGDYTENLVKPGNSFSSPTRLISAGGQFSVPIYQGGAVRNAVKAAKFHVEAGQADLRATEVSIFAQVVGAYIDVIRDQAYVQLNQKNVYVMLTHRQDHNHRVE